MKKRSFVAPAVASAVALGGVVVLVGPAGADPRPVPGQTSTIDCGSGAMDMTIAGNGAWTPAHIAGSTKVYVPVAFGESTSTFVVLDGPHAGETGEGPAPDASTKGGVRKGQRSMECTYSLSGTFYEPNFDGTISFSSTGTVRVLVVGA